MPEIVKPQTLVILRPAQADLPRQVVERSTNRRAVQTAAVIVEKEAGRRCVAQKPVAAPGVIGHDVPSGSMEWNQAGLAELRLPDGEDAVAEVHIWPLQLEHLADTQSCHCQQSEQAVVCPRPQALAWR